VSQPPEEFRAAAATWRPAETSVEGRIDEWSARALAALLGAAVPLAGRPLPLAWHEAQLHEAPTLAELGPDGHSLGGLLPPLSARQRRFGGGEIEVLAPLVVGATATRVSRVAQVRLRQGRSGWLLLVTEEHEISSEGSLRVRDRRDIVYRAAADVWHGTVGEAADPPAAPPAAPPAGAASMTLDPDPRLLFMYSALTYNAHRIHYDPDYVRDVEGHGRLLVHGPLTATACAEVARRVVGDLRSLTYRLVAPAFAGSSVTFHAQRSDDGGCAVWATQDGRVCAHGTAR
jgi:3-methylfumaryl-CoA hydratase